MPLPRWQLFGRDIVGPEDNPMIVRWVILKTPWFAVFWHAFQREDADPFPHDHPWRFWSLLVRGGYVEEYFATPRESCKPATRNSARFRRFPLTAAHRIVDVVPGTRTLVFAGRRLQQWGFYVDTNEWVSAPLYFERTDMLPKPKDRIGGLLAGLVATGQARVLSVGEQPSWDRTLPTPVTCGHEWASVGFVRDIGNHSCSRTGPHYRHTCDCGSSEPV